VRRAGAWRASQVKEDFCVIAASYGPTSKEEVTTYTVRGVVVSPVHVAQIIDRQGRAYGWYVFPTGAVQLVNEGNVRERRSGRVNGVQIQGKETDIPKQVAPQ
jgi:hypothetical protein